MAALLSQTAWAGSSGGQSAPLSRYCAGTQPLSVGGAVVSLATDPATILVNPSGAAYSRDGNFVANYTMLPMDRSIGFLGYSRQMDQFAGFSLSWVHSGVDGVKAYDADGNRAGDLDNSENLIAASFARRINWVSLGVSAKWYRIALDEESASAWAFDFGVTATPLVGLRIGAAVRDLIGTLDWNEGQTSTTYPNKTDVPMTLAVGTSYLYFPLRTTFAVDYERTEGEGQYLHGGASVHVTDQFRLRAGYRWLPIGSAAHEGGLTAGASFAIEVGASRLFVDYSILNDVFGMVHSIGLRYSV